MDLQPGAQPRGPGGDGIVDAPDDVLPGGAVGEAADDLAFGKDSAGGADGHRMLAALIQLRQLPHVRLQNSGHDLQKAAGARGALVVHDEALQNPGGAQLQRLGVLAADVDDRADPRAEEHGPGGVAAELTAAVPGSLHMGPAVAGGDDAAHVLPPKAGGGEHLFHGPDGAAGARPQGNEGAARNAGPSLQ